MILTVVTTAPAHPTVAADRQDVCRMHARVVSLLGLDPDQPKSRELWAQPRPDRLLVQHERAADVRWLPDGYHTGHTVREVRTDWPTGQPIRWVLIANAVKDVHVDRGTGRRTNRREPIDPVAWARRRLAMIDHHDVTLLERRSARGRKPGGQRVVHDQSRLTGHGTVIDPTQLEAALVGGVGKGRAYGCGLLLVEAAR